MHGYAIISIMRKKHHVYFGASIIYPLLNDLEHDGLIISRWNMTGKRPRKIYEITPKGQVWLVQTDTALESENIIELKTLQIER
jgi:DNA-binding PadR family transcriptional regulator